LEVTLQDVILVIAGIDHHAVAAFLPHHIGVAEIRLIIELG
jgi:hypothetical protein